MASALSLPPTSLRFGCLPRIDRSEPKIKSPFKEYPEVGVRMGGCLRTGPGLCVLAAGEALCVLHLPRGRPLECRAQAVEFGVAIGDYSGVVRVPRRILPTPASRAADP